MRLQVYKTVPRGEAGIARPVVIVAGAAAVAKDPALVARARHAVHGLVAVPVPE